MVLYIQKGETALVLASTVDMMKLLKEHGKYSIPIIPK